MRALVVVRAGLAFAAVALAGCTFDPGPLDFNLFPDLPQEDFVKDNPPSVDVTLLADESAIGPDGEVQIDTWDDLSSSVRLDVTFANTVSMDVPLGTVTLTGAELGEGYGDIRAVAHDDDGGHTDVVTGRVLVDLTPPEIDLSPCIVGGDGALSAAVGDAWALGSIDLTVGDANFHEDFPQWPATLGSDWDWTLFEVPAAQLPAGATTATLIAIDHVGNETDATCDLLVDTSAPEVTLTASLDDDGVIHAIVSASDDDTGAEPSLEVASRGAVLAEGSGPSTGFTLTAADFPAGPLPLEGRAIDRAGNVGVSAPVVLEIR